MLCYCLWLMMTFFIMLKNLKAKLKTTLECSISFDFSMRMLVCPVGSEKPVGFFSLAHSDAFITMSQAQGGGDQINFPQNKSLIEQQFFLILSNVSLGYACGISSFLTFEKFLC